MISESLRRTILGVVSAILSVLMFTGLLSPEQVDSANEGVVSLLENGGGVVTALIALWGIFTNGSDKN